MTRVLAGVLIAFSGAWAAVACVVDDGFSDGQFLCDPKGGSDECPPGQKCSPTGTCQHATANPDGGSCFPTNCAALYPKCGAQNDGCGKTLDCGCEDPDTCGGNPLRIGTCGCSPHQSLTLAPDAVYDPGGAGATWKAVDNAKLSDNSYATTANPIAAGKISNPLKAAAFGFKLPKGIKITGVQVEIERSATSSNTALQDKEVRLFSGTTVYPTVLPSPNLWSKVDSSATYGSDTELWGASDLTPAKVESPDFGVSLSVTASASDTPRVDQFKVTVFFDNPACQSD